MLSSSDTISLNVTSRQDLASALAALGPTLKHFARRHCRLVGDAEDLAQDTICTALRFADLYTPGKPLEPWLRTIMRNLFITQVRRPKVETLGFDQILSLMACYPPAQEWAVSKSNVQQAMARLNPKWRQALVEMSGGATYEEAAAVIGCEIGTLKSRVRRARQALTADIGNIFQ